jgi:hypothetical protein
LDATAGGTIQDEGFSEQQWVFSGTQSQSYGIQVLVGGGASVGASTIFISGITTDGDSTLSPPITDQFILTVTTSSRRDLQNDDDSTGLPRFLEDSAVNVLDPNAQGARHCDSEVALLHDNADFPLPVVDGMFTVETQNHVTVSYTITHTITENINWMAVLYADDPVGLTDCVSEVFSFDQETSHTANCFDHRSTAYIYLNVDADINNVDTTTNNNNSTVYLPTACKAPDGVPEGGILYVYEVSIPCSACISDSSVQRQRQRQRRRALMNDVPPKKTKTSTNRHLERIAQSMMTGNINRNKRYLQTEELLGAANRIEMEFMLVGDEGNSSAISFVNVATLLSSSFAVVVVSLLLLL